MPERHLPVADAKYRPLKSFVSRRAGVRFAIHGGLRDRIVEMIVEEWPTDCPLEHIPDVVHARVAVRIRERYSGVLASFLISVLANYLVRLVLEWWWERGSHRVLMAGWANASQNPDVSS
jgi:hypothetical protein